MTCVQAGQVLRSLGFKDVSAMKNGYGAWVDAGGPVQELQPTAPQPPPPHALGVPMAAMA